MPHFSPRCALVAIDEQKEYVSGHCRIEYPAVSSSLAKIAGAKDVARQERIPVVVVQHILPADAPIFAAGPPGAALHPVVATRQRELLVEKRQPSTFADTGLGALLERHVIDTLTVVGYMIHHCNESTIRQAMHEGFDVELLSHACGSLSYANNAGCAGAREMHYASTVAMASGYALVMTTAERIALLAGGQSAPRDNIFSSHRRALAQRGVNITEEAL